MPLFAGRFLHTTLKGARILSRRGVYLVTMPETFTWHPITFVAWSKFFEGVLPVQYSLYRGFEQARVHEMGGGHLPKIRLESFRKSRRTGVNWRVLELVSSKVIADAKRTSGWVAIMNFMSAVKLLKGVTVYRKGEGSTRSMIIDIHVYECTSPNRCMQIYVDILRTYNAYIYTYISYPYTDRYTLVFIHMDIHIDILLRA